MITELEPNQIFVFGSNGQGSHGAGAAKFAYDKGWTKTGHAHGLMWRSFAIDTMDGLEIMEMDIKDLKITARLNPALTFMLTKVGTGIAKIPVSIVAPLCKDMPTNVVLPKEFIDYINKL